MVSARQKKSRNRGQLNRLDENSNYFVIGNGITVNTLGNENLEPQSNGRHDDFERVLDSARQNEVIGSNTDNRIRDAVDSVVIAVKKCMHDAILTAMSNMVIPRVEMAVRSFTGSSGSGPKSLVQNPDRIDFTDNTANTPLRSDSSRLELNIEQDEIDEAGVIDKFEDGDFPEARHIYDRREHAHHMVTGVG